MAEDSAAARAASATASRDLFIAYLHSAFIPAQIEEFARTEAQRQDCLAWVGDLHTTLAQLREDAARDLIVNGTNKLDRGVSG